MTPLRWLVAIAVLVCASPAASAGQPYFLSDVYAGNIHRLEDANSDGDALDAGERTVWASNLGSAFELTRYGSGLLAVDNVGSRVVRLTDNNSDGDALDASEAVTWADGFTGLYGISVDRTGAALLADYVGNRVFRAIDANQDGDALDAGEKTLFADGFAGPLSVQARRNDALVSSFNLGQVHRLIDANGDGDALDANENLVHTPNSISQAEGLLTAANEAYFVGSRNQNAIFRVRDSNGDGDALDVAEVMVYADNFNGPVNGPWGIAPRVGGGLLAANYLANNVVIARDGNGDGDGLDVGESLLFSDGFPAAGGILAGVGPGASGRMITIQTLPGTLDVAAPNFVAVVEGSTLRNASIAARLNAGTSVLVSTDAPATFADGDVVQLVGAPIAKTAGGAATTLTIRADDTIELAGGVS